MRENQPGRPPFKAHEVPLSPKEQMDGAESLDGIFRAIAAYGRKNSVRQGKRTIEPTIQGSQKAYTLAETRRLVVEALCGDINVINLTSSLGIRDAVARVIERRGKKEGKYTGPIEGAKSVTDLFDTHEEMGIQTGKVRDYVGIEVAISEVMSGKRSIDELPGSVLRKKVRELMDQQKQPRKLFGRF